MNDDARKLRNEYLRNWRAKNKDKVKAIQNRYWERKANNLVAITEDKCKNR